MDSIYGRASRLGNLADPGARWFAILRRTSPHRLPRLTQYVMRQTEAALRRAPLRTFPYLKWVLQEQGPTKAHETAISLSAGDASAELLVEVAKYRYSRDNNVVGDQLIARAKRISPDLLRIFEEEAWNQRQRGNHHREIAAVRRCLELAGDPGARRDWSLWLGEALLRRGDARAAWEHLSQFSELGEGDPRLFSVASCARMLGHSEAARSALRRAAPDGTGGVRIVDAATAYLGSHRNPSDALWVLGSVSSESDTRALELAAHAQILSGNWASAADLFEAALDRNDLSRQTRRFHGALLEFLDRPESAISVYTGTANPTSFELFRAGALLAKQGRHEEAVSLVLASPVGDTAAGRPETEADPRMAQLLMSARDTGISSVPTENLKQIALRASGFAPRHNAQIELAQRMARNRHWQEAWSYIIAAQDERLPVLPLTQLEKPATAFSGEIRYAEARETEPVQPDLIMYESSLGAGTTCNPLAMCLELLSDPEHAHLFHIWSLSEGATIHPALRDHDRVFFVRKGSPGFSRYLAIAGYLVTNSTLPTEFIKRPEQRVLNTWHGVPWKTLGRDNAGEPAAYGNISRNFLHSDIVLTSDEHTHDVLARGMDVDELVPHTFVRADAPRLDLTLSLTHERRQEIRSLLGVGDDECLVLYMPTWRGQFQQRAARRDEVHAIAHGLAIPGARVAVRAHHYVRSSFSTETSRTGHTSIPESVDTNEAIGAADVLVTDYSSVLFDAAVVGIPVIKLIGDIEEYRSERGLYFLPEEVPGLNARSLGEARKLISLAIDDPEAYTAQYASATKRFGGNATGQASRHAIDLLFARDLHQDVTPNSKRSVLVSTEGFPSEIGITRSLRSLLRNFHDSDCSIYLRPWPSALINASPDTREDIYGSSRLLIGVGKPAGNRMERETLEYFSSQHYVDSPAVRKLLASGRTWEGRRRFGTIEFTAAVDFSGYLSSSIALIAFGVAVTRRRGVIFHNEMAPEISNKYPQLASGMSILNELDFVASVSDGVRDANRQELARRFEVDPERHVTIENTLDVPSIRELAEIPLEDKDKAWYGRSGRHVCVVARFSPEKNHSSLLEALVQVRDEIAAPIFLTLLGDGPLKAETEMLCAKLGLLDLVRFCGQVRAPQAHLRASDVLLLPSLHEGQPLVLLEALTVGTPVIATDTPGSRSVLRNGALGLLVPVSGEGLRLALKAAASGHVPPPSGFDADAFTHDSIQQFRETLGLSEKRV